MHNIDKLLGVVSRNLSVLSRAGLEQRRIVQGMTPKDAAAYVTIEDVRAMRKAVGKWRSVYEARYREIRHKVFAHKSVSRVDADALMAKTNIDEMKEMLGFLHALYMSLFQLHLNGIRPDIMPVMFDLSPAPGESKAAERMYREGAALLDGMLDGEP